MGGTSSQSQPCNVVRPTTQTHNTTRTLPLRGTSSQSQPCNVVRPTTHSHMTTPTIPLRFRETGSSISEPISQKNESIARRFEEEHAHDQNWSDSEASEGEREDIIGELPVLKEITGSQQCVFPLHIILVIDSSKSMKKCDVDGKQRLNEVFNACHQFIVEQSAKTHAGSAQYSLLTFNSQCVVHCERCSVGKTLAHLLSAREMLLPKGDALFMEAFRGILSVLENVDLSELFGDVCVVLFSDGLPRESPDSLVQSMERTLLTKTCVRGLHRFIIHTVGFGSGNRKIQLMPGEYSASLEIDSDGLVLETSVQSERLGLKIGSKVLRIDGKKYSHSQLEKQRAGTQPFTLTLEASCDVEECLKPLSARTGGAYEVAKLSVLDLSRAYSSIGSSIESSRVSGSLAPPVVPSFEIKFDSRSDEVCCTRVCVISKVASYHEGKSSLRDKETDVPCSIQQASFAHGAMRLVYRMEDKSKLNQKQHMVAKRLIAKEHAGKDDMLPFCINTHKAISFRNAFLDALNKKSVRKVDLFFVPCYLYHYKHDAGEGYFVGEQMLDGTFIKFNNNDGWKNKDHHFSELMQALSHFSFIHSKARLLLVDLQGTVDKNTVLLTDPQILSQKDKSDYGRGDLPCGIRSFFSTHVCGITCKRLNLHTKFDALLRELGGSTISKRRVMAGPPRRRRAGHASATVHEQIGGTCYANAVATILRQAEDRIVGRQVEPHRDIVRRIVKKHGSSGGCCQQVLREECPSRCLRYRIVSAEIASQCLRDGRSVLISFRLTSEQWDAFSCFFEEHPSGVLKMLPAPKRVSTASDGHACVIVDVHDDIFTIKNSWGESFANSGSFCVQRNMFESFCSECTYIDVFFNECDLRDADRRAYQQMESNILHHGLNAHGVGSRR